MKARRPASEAGLEDRTGEQVAWLRKRERRVGRRRGKPCAWEGCKVRAPKGERYCEPHRAAMVRRMQKDGYLY